MGVTETMARLKAVQHQLFGVFVERRKERDSTMPTRLQSHVLESVRDQGETSTSEVAEMLNISVPTASQLVNTLVERGWMLRETEVLDRRRHRLSLTDQGNALVTAQTSERRDRMEALLTQLSAEERTALVALAERIQELWTKMEHDRRAPDPEGSSVDGNR